MAATLRSIYTTGNMIWGDLGEGGGGGRGPDLTLPHSRSHIPCGSLSHNPAPIPYPTFRITALKSPGDLLQTAPTINPPALVPLAAVNSGVEYPRRWRACVQASKSFGNKSTSK